MSTQILTSKQNSDLSHNTMYNHFSIDICKHTFVGLSYQGAVYVFNEDILNWVCRCCRICVIELWYIILGHLTPWLICIAWVLCVQRICYSQIFWFRGSHTYNTLKDCSSAYFLPSMPFTMITSLEPAILTALNHRPLSIVQQSLVLKEVSGIGQTPD